MRTSRGRPCGPGQPERRTHLAPLCESAHADVRALDVARCDYALMVGSRVSLQVNAVVDSRWSAALDLLESGETWIGLGNLILSCDAATAKTRRRLHVEFPCLSDPLRGDGPAPDRLGDVASDALVRARDAIGSACHADRRFSTLVADSDVLYEFVYDYGMGTLLVATARPEGPLTWKQ